MHPIYQLGCRLYQLAFRAAREANPLYPVPKLMDAHELAAMYHRFIPREEP